MPDDWTNPDSVIALVAQHLRLHPLMQPRDVYKLLYQGVLGSEHLIQGGAAAALEFEKRLRAEFDAVEADESEPLLESVHPAGALHRLNLRPYKARRGDLSLLSAECLRVAHASWGTPADLRLVWDTYLRACQAGTWPAFDPSAVLDFTRWLEANAFPAVHHSPLYRETYRPAYRLVAASLLNDYQ